MDDKTRPARRLLAYLRPYRWSIAVGLGCLVLAQPFQLAHPLFWKFVVDDVLVAEQPRFAEWVGGSRVTLLLIVCVAMVAAYAIGLAINAGRSYLLGVVAQKIGFDLRRDLYARFQQHAMRYFHDRRSGDLVARAVGDVETVQQFATNGVDEVLGNIFQLLLVWGIIFALSWQVGLSLLLPIAAVALMVWRFNRVIRPLYRLSRDRLGDVSAKIQENVGAMSVIKAFVREKDEQARVDDESRRYLDTATRAIRVRTMFQPTVQVVGFVSNGVMLGVGGYFILRGEFTIGGLVALRGYWWHLFQPVWSLARVNDMWQRSLAASERVFTAMDDPLEIADASGAEHLDQVRGGLSLREVSFGYRPDGPPVLDHVDVEVPAGSSLGVVGPSGAGKSTLLSLILRFYEPRSGAVLLDGRDLRELTQQSVRRHMAVVTQEPVLFAGTVRENILFGRPDASEQAMFEAARQANAHEFILSLPDGYDTTVGERGVKLSGGQKQRVCIARAFLADPRILLLDEATASVEPESEAIIQRALERLMQGRTAVVVSHRLSMVRNCDQIIVVKDARIAERGSADELLAGDGWFSRMYALQTR